MKTSERGIQLIKSHEGLRLNAYLCPAGVWTIGYGHTKTAKEGMRISPAQATELLKKDLGGFEKVVELQLPEATQNQFDALVSFVYNVGSGNFNKSSLLKKVQLNPHDPSIRDEFMRWTKAGGKVWAGLVRRRTEEADLYFGILK